MKGKPADRHYKGGRYKENAVVFCEMFKNIV